MDIQAMLARTFYGNTVYDWLVSLLIVFAAVVVGKILYWISGNIIKKLTSKTKTKLDDILVDMIEEPAVFSLTLLGIWVGVKRLTLSEAALAWIWHVFEVLIIINIAWLITRLFDSLYTEYLVPLAGRSKTDLDDQLLPIVRKGTKIIVWIIAVVVALNNAGYNVSAVLAGLGIGGLALAMAAKDTISNIFGGFTIFTDKPFKVGDRIKVNGLDGFVREIGLRSTRIETLEGRRITIPNSAFSENPVENISIEPSRKVTVNLGVTYDTTPKKMEEAKAILKGITKRNKNVEEKVIVIFSDFNDSSLNIRLIYHIKKGADILGTQSDINMEILEAFNSKKIEFAFPTRTVYAKSC
jgi:MscS family membrane protein